MNPYLVRIIVMNLVVPGIVYGRKRFLARRIESRKEKQVAYLLNMMNRHDVEFDEFDEIALKELGITIHKEEA